MKLFGKIFVLVLLSVTFFVPVAKAAENRTPVTVTLEKNQIVNKDYFAAGDTVRLSGTVNGDAYVAGGSVIVDGVINGDLLVAGGTVQIMGPVKNDIRAVGGTVTLGNTVGGNATIGSGTVMINPQAKITGSLLAGGGTVDILGPIGKGLTAGGGQLAVNNSVGGDVTVGGDDIVFGAKTNVRGTINYWSDKTATFNDNVQITGDTIRHDIPKSEKKDVRFIAKGGTNAAIAAMLGMVATITLVSAAALFLVGFALFHMFPIFSDRVLTGMQKNAWGSFGLGIAISIVLPVLAVIAFITLIGIPVGMFIIMALLILCLLGHLYAARYVGRWAFTLVHADVHMAWQLLLGLVLFGVLTVIPVVGWLVHAILVLMATGALLFEKHSVYRALRTRRMV